MVYFDKCDVAVNGTGLLAESASFSAENSLAPYYALGFKGPIGHGATGPVKCALKIDYIMETNNEPVFGIVSGLKEKHQNYNYDRYTVGIGGITGYSFLESYNVKLTTNDVGRASATFISFIPMSGNFTGRATDVNITYNSQKTTGIAHGWTTVLYLRSVAVEKTYYDFEYSFQARWEPVFVLGQKYPEQMQFLGAEESLVFVRDVFSGINYTGHSAVQYLDNIDRLQANNLGFLVTTNNRSHLHFDFSGAYVKNTQASSPLDDFTRVATTCLQQY